MNIKDKRKLLRKEVYASKKDPKALEEALVSFADVATGEQLFQLCLELMKFNSKIAICYIARAATPNAITWLNKRKSDPYVNDMMNIWLMKEVEFYVE